MAPIFAPLDGSLSTLLDFVDFHAENNPELPWLVYPSATSKEELSSITFSAMARASHRIAHTLRPGRSGPEGRIVAILLQTDTAVYVAVMLGVIRAGYIPYPMSPRNSAQGVRHMLDSTGSRRILSQKSTTLLSSQVQSEMLSTGTHLEVTDLSMLDDVLLELIGNRPSAVLSEEKYPSTAQTFTLDDPLLYLHSSGSTGPPKSVPFPHHQVLQNLRRHLFGTKRREVRFGAMGLPTFHSMGLMLQMFFPLCSSQAVAVFTPQHPAPPIVPTPVNIYEVGKLTRSEGLIATPSFVEVWSHSPDIVDYLKTLKVIVFGGGPLSLMIGDKLANAGVPLYCGYGGSEFGSPTQSWDELPEDELRHNRYWSWLRFSKAPRLEWVPQGDGAYELVVYSTDEYKVRCPNIPGGCATADLFEQHSTRKDLWRLVGRKDDVITLSSGEKIVPIAQEGRVNASPLVSGCVMFGREQAQAGLLVEVKPEHTFDRKDGAAFEHFRDRLWPAVEQANDAVPAYAKIYKDMIIVTDPARPLPRSAKNTIIRKQALVLYAQEIEALYTDVKDATEAIVVSPPSSWKSDDLRTWLSEQISFLIGTESLSTSTNLFHQGLDSLSATFLRNHIATALRSSGTPSLEKAAHNLSANLVFEHMTIDALAIALAAFSTTQNGIQSPANGHTTRLDEINTLLNEFGQDIPYQTHPLEDAEHTAPVVLLTGSTGNIGSHILASLLAESRVSRVYALNRRSDDPSARQRDAFQKRGLPEELLQDERLVSLVGDIARDGFDLEQHQYTEILASVTHVIHNAWPVNFNLPLQAFKQQIAGVRRLIDICARSDRPIWLLQTSSIGVTSGWDVASGAVPESPLDASQLNHSKMNGYRGSKHIVEQICRTAVTHGIPITTVRMGQACGPRATGAWGTTEWFPIMLKSSIALGCFPNMSGSVAWVPLDAIGQAYVDWVLSSEKLPDFVNVVHPHPTSWNVVIRGVHDELGETLPIVTLGEWVAKLEQRLHSSTMDQMVEIPAYQIIDFFRDLLSASRHTSSIPTSQKASQGVQYCTTSLEQSSPTLRELGPISEEHVRMWVRFWRTTGWIS